MRVVILTEKFDKMQEKMLQKIQQIEKIGEVIDIKFSSDGKYHNCLIMYDIKYTIAPFNITCLMDDIDKVR